MNRHGVALLLAVTALAALGVVAASGVLLASREAGLGSRALARVRAGAAADGALAEAHRGWPAELSAVALGDSVPLAVVAFPGSATGTVFLHFLGGPLYALRATGNVGVVATQRLELLIEIDTSGLDSLARPRPVARGWRRIP